MPKFEDTYIYYPLGPRGGYYVNSADIARAAALQDNATNAMYVAAYIKNIQDRWQGAFPAIARRPDILGTIYNNDRNIPHANPQSNDFGVYTQRYYNAMGYLLGINKR